MKTREIGTKRSWSFILKVVHFITADVQVTHQIVFYFIWQILFWMFSLTNQAPIDISWQRIETVIAYKQPIPAALEWYLLDSIWAHPVAVTAFSHLWLQRQSEIPKETEFASSVTLKSCLRTLGRAAKSKRKIPDRWLWLVVYWECPDMAHPTSISHHAGAGAPSPSTAKLSGFIPVPCEMGFPISIPLHSLALIFSEDNCPQILPTVLSALCRGWYKAYVLLSCRKYSTSSTSAPWVLIMIYLGNSICAISLQLSEVYFIHRRNIWP